MFSTLSKKNCTICATLKLSSANAFNLDKAKIMLSGKGLTLYYTILIIKNPGNQHFLLFPKCFPSFQNQISVSVWCLFFLLQMFSIWISLKHCCLVQAWLGSSVFSMSDSWPGACGFDTWFRLTSFFGDCSPLTSDACEKVVSDLERKLCQYWCQKARKHNA